MLFRTIHEARAAVHMYKDFHDPTLRPRRFYIAKVKFTLLHDTISEVKRPLKRRYII